MSENSSRPIWFEDQMGLLATTHIRLESWKMIIILIIRKEV